jgi:hypothetical protein
LFEGGVLRPTIKEVDKSLRQIKYRRLKTLRIALLEPFILSLPHWDLFFHRESRDAFSSLFVGLGHCSQRLIPHKANTAKSLRQVTLLLNGWINSDFDCLQHSIIYRSY